MSNSRDMSRIAHNDGMQKKVSSALVALWKQMPDAFVLGTDNHLYTNGCEKLHLDPDALAKHNATARIIGGIATDQNGSSLPVFKIELGKRIDDFRHEARDDLGRLHISETHNQSFKPLSDDNNKPIEFIDIREIFPKTSSTLAPQNNVVSVLLPNLKALYELLETSNPDDFRIGGERTEEFKSAILGAAKEGFIPDDVLPLVWHGGIDGNDIANGIVEGLEAKLKSTGDIQSPDQILLKYLRQAKTSANEDRFEPSFVALCDSVRNKWDPDTKLRLSMDMHMVGLISGLSNMNSPIPFSSQSLFVAGASIVTRDMSPSQRQDLLKNLDITLSEIQQINSCVGLLNSRDANNTIALLKKSYDDYSLADETYLSFKEKEHLRTIMTAGLTVDSSKIGDLGYGPFERNVDVPEFVLPVSDTFVTPEIRLELREAMKDSDVEYIPHVSR